jgi:hypothetical protein
VDAVFARDDMGPWLRQTAGVLRAALA